MTIVTLKMFTIRTSQPVNRIYLSHVVTMIINFPFGVVVLSMQVPPLPSPPQALIGLHPTITVQELKAN